MSPEEHVILVDENDRPLGTAEKMDAHRKGLLHRAVSVLVMDSAGRMLLQRRAADKYHSAGLWTNACCSHPRPGEDNAAAAERRLIEEMGIACRPEPLFAFVYRAELDSGLTEHEYDHVFLCRTDALPVLNPAEADDFAYMHIEDIRSDMARSPERYTEWFKILLPKFIQTQAAA
jgi:isopentenyl-diphosphate Delta-isomerase